MGKRTAVLPGPQSNNKEGKEGFEASKLGNRRPHPTVKKVGQRPITRNYRGVVVVVVDVVSFCT